MISFESPLEIVRAYENGLPGWQFNPETMDDLFIDGKVTSFMAAAPRLSGVGAGKSAHLWRSREKYDPGAFGLERQTRGSCVSHGSRNARDTTRAVEIDIKGEAEEYYKRGATEPTYAARGNYGEGMDPARATRFEIDNGFLFREKYDFADLSQLNDSIAEPRLLTDELIAKCREHNVGRYVSPETVGQVKDLLFSGYAIHSGQNIGFATRSDSRGIAVVSGRWNHDMATVGYDDTKEVYPECVYLVANSWGRWNEKPKVWPEDRLGPWPVGSFWVSEDVYARYFVGSRSIFAYCDIKGVPQKNLPNWGDLKDVLG